MNIAVPAILTLALLALGGEYVRYRRRVPRRLPVVGDRRILFPYVADALSSRTLDAALRLASAENATLVPVFLARVSMQLPLDTPLTRQCELAIPLQEAIEQRANASGIPVDARIERGRSYRHALRQTIANERFDRLIVAAAAPGTAGFHPDDVAWLLANAPGEILVLRPDQDEQLGPPAPKAIARASVPGFRRRQSETRHRRSRPGREAKALPPRR
jgi:nucleotide-binding universal stress UspA family protein